MKVIKNIFTAIGRFIGFMIKFGFFGTTLWLTTFAGLILWHALPEIMVLRVLTEMAVGATFLICWTGLPTIRKKTTEE